MELAYYIESFKSNTAVFEDLLRTISKQEFLWREHEGKWCLLEVICHLYDEEREDFRARLRSVLEDPAQPFTPIDPVGWVTERRYVDKDFQETLNNFIKEREVSLNWLLSAKDAAWDNAYMHPKMGPVSAQFLLANWLAHDHLHIRQITRIKYHYLQFHSGQSLDYAGDW